MGDNDPGGAAAATERWDQVLEALSARPRRSVLAALSDVPGERRVPLPDAVTVAEPTADATHLEMALRHHHLPLLASAGYVRWSDDPFVVQRGPNYEEVGSLIEVLLSAGEDLPDELTAGWGEPELGGKYV